MKKKLIMGAAAISLLGLVSAAVGLSQSAMQKIDAAGELRAHVGYTAGDTIYIEPKAAWTADNAKFAFYFFQSANDSNNKWSPVLDIPTYMDADGFYKYTLDESFTLEYDTVIGVRLNSSATVGNWGDKTHQTSDLSASINTNCIWLPNDLGQSGGGFFVHTENSYVLHVGTKFVDMTINPENLNQVYGTITGASAGDWIGVSLNGADPGTIFPEEKYSNNANGENKLKVGGDVSVYLNRSDWGAWVSGYAPNSVPLQNFCDELLSNSISAGSCSLNSGSWNALNDRWNANVTGDNAAQYNLSDDDRLAFTNAVSNEGNIYNYSSVVQEAKTRYMYMVKSKGATDFANFLGAAKANQSVLSERGNASLAIAIIVGVSAIAAGGFLLLRRRRVE